MKSWLPIAAIVLAGCPSPEVDLGDFAGFEEVTSEWGVAAELANGVCVTDIDGQLGPDLYLARPGEDRLYMNQGDGTFVESGSFGDRASQGCGYADFDRDGDPDLVITTLYEASRYLRNDDGVLVDITAEVGLGDTFNQRSVLVEDIDRDGWTDLVLTTTQGEQAGLFRNLGDGTFEDRTPDSPLLPVRRSWGGAFLDYDDDGLPDLFLAKDISPEVDQLLHNEGDFVFVDATVEAGVSNVNHAMGIAITDLDADGLVDFFVTNWGHHVMWRNEGGSFLDVANAWGVGTRGGASGWGTFFVDADHDGDEDLFVANGAGFLAGDPETPVRPRNEANRFFLQSPEDGHPMFGEAGEAVGLADEDSALGAAWGDFDGDGWVDIVVANALGDSIRIFRNLGVGELDSEAPLRLRLVGTVSNPDAFGAHVTVEACGLRQARVRTQGASVLSAGSEVLHFGLADCTEDVLVTVRWPTGESDEVTVPAPAWGDEPVLVTE
ncbi:MAG: CRTAC1 family protein [Proteobacteria bacterium]|nr:CRTAC1 family protein [Pseudomonadota bacterium]